MKRKKVELTHKYLKEALDYDPSTGIFTWRLDRPEYHFEDWRGRNGFISNIKDNLVAGSPSRKTKRNPVNYVVIGLGGRNYKAHRLAWFYVYGDWPEDDIDHINLNTLDNSINNLRVSVDKINHRNRSRYRNNKSGIPGVSFYTRLGKWQAEGQQVLDGKRIRHYLGVYTSFFDACCARKRWELEFDYSPNHGKVIDKWSPDD